MPLAAARVLAGGPSPPSTTVPATASGPCPCTLLRGLFTAGDGAPHNPAITVGTKAVSVRLLSGAYDPRTRTMRYRVRALRGSDRLPSA